MSVFPSLSLLNRPLDQKDAKITDSNHKLSFHSRRIPADTGQPFTVTLKVIVVEKMPFEDCPVSHDSPSARNVHSAAKEFAPFLADRRQARALSARFCQVEVRNHDKCVESRDTSIRQQPEEDNFTSKALFQFGCPRTSRLQLSLISFCQFHRELAPHRVTRRTRNQAICFIARRQRRIRHVD